MKVLLSIKPEFAEKILTGEKKFEFRKKIFKNKDIKKVLLYASSPVQKVIGEFEIEEIFQADIATLWSKTNLHAGITKDYFSAYFSAHKSGFAIKVKKAKRFKKPQCLRSEYNLFPPQSFAYIV